MRRFIEFTLSCVLLVGCGGSGGPVQQPSVKATVDTPQKDDILKGVVLHGMRFTPFEAAQSKPQTGDAGGLTLIVENEHPTKTVRFTSINGTPSLLYAEVKDNNGNDCTIPEPKSRHGAIWTGQLDPGEQEERSLLFQSIPKAATSFTFRLFAIVNGVEQTATFTLPIARIEQFSRHGGDITLFTHPQCVELEEIFSKKRRR